MSIWHRFIHPITAHFRRRRGELLLKMFPGIGTARIVDVGGSRHFWDKVDLPIPWSNLTIYNISLSETSGQGDGRYGAVPVLLYDGSHLPLEDHSVDLVVSNSVIEHVPPDQREAFAYELLRVGRSVYVQTPARSFPIEPHFVMPFIHWLPRRIGYLLVFVSVWRLLARPSRATIREYWWGTRLLGRAELERLFPRCEILEEKVMGMTKSYMVIKDQKG